MIKSLIRNLSNLSSHFNILIMSLILFGLCLELLGLHQYADPFLLITIAAGSARFLKNIINSFLHHKFGIDLIAFVGSTSALLLGQYSAGAVILLMLFGGQYLEDRAMKRARRELTELLKKAPSVAHLKVGDDLVDIPANEVQVSQILIIKPGDIIPVDGTVIDGVSNIDESLISGESMPVQKQKGMQVLSGTLNLEDVLTIKATHRSVDSRFNSIVKLVEQAESSKAPFIRLADRVSVYFTALAFGLSGLAWFISADPIRALSVLVVATPCPLILAAPTAFASGISKASGLGIVIKNAQAMEKLARLKVFLFDKTGTLTLGTPTFEGIENYSKFKTEKLIAIAASLDQLSNHILSRALLAYALKQKIDLDLPEQFDEHLGAGVHAVLDSKKYYFGKLKFLKQQGIKIASEIQNKHDTDTEKMRVYLADSSKVLAVFYFSDQIRVSSTSLFRFLHHLKIDTLIVTGDKPQAAQAVAEAIGVSRVYSECSPEQKLEILATEKRTGFVAMLGDGVNDAPALAASDVGISFGGHGSTAAAESADVIIMGSSLIKIQQLIEISRLVMTIAIECIVIGIGLSILLMIGAVVGLVQPLTGAILQEMIDVTVILNALRVHTKTRF